MKKLIDKLKPGAEGEERQEDQGFFTTMFMEQRGDTQRLANWRSRSTEVGAVPFDRRVGAELFAELWGVDHFVATLSRSELSRMSDYLDFVTVRAGQELISQDEQGDFMMIVLEGLIAVDRIQPWGGRARLAEAQPGDMLGEMSLLDAGSRFSACTTLTPCNLAVIDAHRLDRMVSQDPRIGLALIASLARRLSLRLRQVSARLSTLLSEGEHRGS